MTTDIRVGRWWPSAASASAGWDRARVRRGGAESVWRLADPAAALGQARTLIARVAVLVRFVLVLPWPIAILLDPVSGIEHEWLAVAVYAVQTVWSLTWAGIVLVRRTIPFWAMAVDVPVAAICLVLAGLACYPQDTTTWANSAIAPALGTVVAVAAAWPLRLSSASGALLVGSYFGGVARGLAYSPTAWAATLGNVCSLIGFGVIAGLVSRHLLRQAEANAAAASELAAARARSAAEESRDRERTRQYRMLHDTVLSTLSLLARGGLDPADPLVRQRCAADADYLRGLISSGGVSAGNQLQGELAGVGREQAALGLRVHLHCADVPVDLPHEVVRALTDACREALNNVVRHAGVDQAWVTARGLEPAQPDDGPARPGSVSVTIADRGAGFDSRSVRPGLGLRESIDGRMTEVGGIAVVDSSPGQGTSVELTWPA